MFETNEKIRNSPQRRYKEEANGKIKTKTKLK